ncbi:DarT1-associated NADAR antitoxin family protein [Primorskyibacter sp. 2E233]|uniref:DarT1-associated NADAR antitoxin family protein n=1 Tax=Primorskyibacter sp. 2E233 TaxID=3413431 RepID=UPI003BF2B31E
MVRVQSVDFTWHAGMAKSRRQMSMRSLHQAARTLHPESRILEVSRMSDEPLGEELSAFNLTLAHRKLRREVSVECAFQASKVFERGGPFTDLLEVKPGDAKRDPRLQDSGRLTGFHFVGEDWPNEPLTAFYDWIYINALHRQPELAAAVTRYDIFTDIAFNPEKSINCQAGAVALYVALVRRGELQAALSSKEAFLRVEAAASVKEDGQGSLF